MSKNFLLISKFKPAFNNVKKYLLTQYWTLWSTQCSCIEHMWNDFLSEDNNTRVLYERVLSSGQVPPEKSIEIWSRFLAFESEVGDLASIQKVEKRRAQAIEKVHK